MDETMFQSCIDSPATVCLYFAVVLVLLFLVVFYLRKNTNAGEEFVGRGYGVGGGYYGQTSGATQRHATEFSATNQDNRTTVSNADLGEVGMSATGRTENLVNGRGEPDFWAITNDLGEYQRGSEHMTNADETDRLKGLLY